jgi:UDP-2-acetamido-2-deoxy-ribo-hexuluronate aminotransferase
MLKKDIPFIDLKSQYQRVKDRIDANIAAVLDHGQYVLGPEVMQLEEALAEYVGSKHCISASSGTDTLMIAMMALEIGVGDEVITSPFTFISTGEMIALLGAKPVFVDIDPQTYNLDPAQVEAAITPATKALMPVSLYGQCAEMDTLNAIADRYGLAVIEDAAQSFGAEYKGRKSCALSTIGSTSFFPSKPLGAYGDGGALFTDDDNLAMLMKQIRVHGQDRHYHHPRLGINGRMDTIQAAVLLAKLEIFPSEVEARGKIAKLYNDRFKDRFETPYVAADNLSVYAQYTLQVDNRDQLQATLKAKGIPTAVHYPVPLNLQPVFEYLDQPAGSFPIAERVATRVLSLPMSPYLSEGQLHHIADSVIAGV